MTTSIICGGPGPHSPANGVLGTADRNITGMRCPAPACAPTPDPAFTNGETIRAQAAAALANLRTIRDAPQVSVTSVAQAQTVCRQLQSGIQSEATALIRLARLLLGQTDGTD